MTDHISKYLNVRRKYSAARRIDFQLSQNKSLMLDMAQQKRLTETDNFSLFFFYRTQAF